MIFKSVLAAVCGGALVLLISYARSKLKEKKWR